jgi:voltage-gated potassium channel
LAAGVTGIGVWFALITSLSVEFDLSDVRRRHRIMRSIEALNDPIVLCGGGRTGRQVMEELMALGQDFVVVERDPKRVEWIQEQ